MNEPVILMDESGREVGFGTVWKREVGEHMDNKPLKSYETAVIVTRCITDVDLIWEPNGYFGRLQKKSSVIGSKETGHKNMMCSLPIRWPSSLLLRPPEVSAAMKCQMSTDHIEGRDNPAFGESRAAQDILDEVCDPLKHPTRQNPSSCSNGKKDCGMCSVKCQFATSRRYIVIVMGYRYEKPVNAQFVEDLVVGVYESFFKRWTFKRSTANRCRRMPEAQGRTEIAILGDNDPRKMAVIFGGLAINVRPGREEVEELFEPTIFYCPLYSRTRRRKQFEFSGRKIDPTNYHNLFNFQMWPPVVVQPFRENGQSAVQAVTRKAVQFPETILVVNVNLDDNDVPTGYFNLLTRMPVDLFQGLLASATMFTPQYIEHSAGEGLICFKAGHNPELVFYDVMWDRWFTAKYPKQQEGVMMKHFQLCEGIWKPSFKQRTGNNDLMLALHP